VNQSVAASGIEPAPIAASPVKQAIIEDFVALGGSRYLAYAVSFAASIVQRRLLGPYIIGVWQLLAIVRMYLSYWDAGVARGAERQLPALAATDRAEFERCRDTTYTFVIATMTTANLVVLAASFFWPWPADVLVLWGVRAMTIIAIVEGFSNMMEASALRTPARFRLLSVQVFVSETLFAVLSLPAAYFVGLWGLLGALFLSLAFKPIYMRMTTGERFHLRWDTDRALGLWRIGFPFTIFVILYKTFDSVDRLLVVRGGDLESLGQYSVATMAAVFLSQVPLVISTVLFPRTMGRFATGTDRELVRYFQQAQLCVHVLLSVASAACYFLLPEVVRHVLPAFTAGIPALKITAVGAIFVGITQLPIQYLVASDRQWSLAVTIGVATAVYFSGGVAIAHWYGSSAAWLQVVAWSRLIAYVLLAGLVTAWALHVLRAISWAWLGEIAAVTLYLATLPLVIDTLGPADATTILGSAARATVQLALYAAGVAPVLLLLERRTGAVTHLAASYRQLRGGTRQ
jgi:O-antigen/teichoic acid export membrane protein